MGSFIDIRAADGSGSFRGYLAVPPAGRGPGIVVCQEIFGVNRTMRAIADGYAAEGFVALVPDLFWRQSPGVELGYQEQDWQRAFAFYKAFDEGKGVEDVGAAVAALRARPECTGRTGVVGFCLGGKLAYLAGCRLADVACAVCYYGVGIEHALDELPTARARLVLHVAAADEYCPPEAQEAIAKAALGHSRCEVHRYPGVGHAFARVGEEHFHEPSARAAHERTINAFKAELTA